MSGRLDYGFTDYFVTVITYNAVISVLGAGRVFMLNNGVFVIQFFDNRMAYFLIANRADLGNISVFFTSRLNPYGFCCMIRLCGVLHCTDFIAFGTVHYPLTAVLAGCRLCFDPNTRLNVSMSCRYCIDNGRTELNILSLAVFIIARINA